MALTRPEQNGIVLGSIWRTLNAHDHNIEKRGGKLMSAQANDPLKTIDQIPIERGFFVKPHRQYRNPDAKLPNPQGPIGDHIGCEGTVFITFLESPSVRQIFCQKCGRWKEILHYLATMKGLWEQFPGTAK